ncbi:MAG: 16S rRNA processing protein RimM [Steroidobacteraceae bacterium]|nr:16S rRNA processing protein RimM [Steroidobacteraceae bacterium]
MLGRIAGPFGVRGWVKVASFTDPPEQILEFPCWRVALPAGGSRELRPLEGRRHGKGLVARIEGVDGRDGAMALARGELWIERGELPALGAGEYYRADLVGLEVVNQDGRPLGRVDHFLDLPANPVMVVSGEREHWVPLVPRHLRRVDLERGRVVVDWDPDF